MPIENLKRPDRLDEERIKQLKEMFPETISDGKIVFSLLNREIANLDEGILEENEVEAYGLRWPGKDEARKLSVMPSSGTLKYLKDQGINEDATKNFLIEGDNLDVLRILKASYRNRIKMVYIDPPYNTGSDFIYNDDFKDPLEKYLQKTGQADEEGLLTANPNSSGRFHTNWLNMIYPRLRLAKELLKKDGIILVHIDENEEFNLELVMNEIFGEGNRLGKIIWDKRNPKGDAVGIAYQHETLLLYAKDKDYLATKKDIVRPKANAEKMLKKAEELYKKMGKTTLPNDLLEVANKYGLDEKSFKEFLVEYDLEAINKEFKKWVSSQDYLSGGESAYNNIDSEGNVYRPVSMAWPNKKKAPDDYFIPLIHPVTKKECPVPGRGWRNPPNTMKKLLDENKILFGVDETTIPNRKYLLKENMFENIPSIIRYGASDDSYFNKIGLNFENPKPYRFVTDIISYFTDGDDIVLDFFAGSGTTGHAVLEANRKDHGNRSFILVQLPEKTEDGSTTIVDLTKARLIKSIELMNNEDNNTNNLDRGLAMFSLNKSNIKKWTSYEGGSLKEMENKIDLFSQEPFVEGWTETDLVFELMLNQGYPLDSEIKRESKSGNLLWVINHKDLPSSLVICTDEKIQHVTGEYLLLNFEKGTFICRDNTLTNEQKILLSESMNVKTI